MAKSKRNAPSRAAVAEREPARRASYGATSPVVGVRGARTREQIVDAALQLFGERGVHGTVVDDIARSVGISRAALYQYFGSKEEIFRELVEESGSAQIRVMRRLGRLGPTAEGFDNLHWWLGEVTYVYEKYATLFVQWANVDTPEGPLRPMLGRFLETYTGRLAERLIEGGVSGVDAGELAMALWAMIERFNYYRHTRVTGLTDDAAVDNLAIVAQLIVFPETPSAVLAAADHSIAVGRNRAQAPGMFEARPGWQPRGGRFASLSDEAFAMVRDILDAGARLFASSGYNDTSVNMIIREAGRARGTSTSTSTASSTSWWCWRASALKRSERSATGSEEWPPPTSSAPGSETSSRCTRHTPACSGCGSSRPSTTRRFARHQPSPLVPRSPA